MYLRHSTVRKDGKTHTYWRLVRSVRHGRRVVQETVAHLGELDAAGRAKAALLAQQITGRREQRQLFEAPRAPVETIAVRVDQVRLERSRRFGDVWMGLTLWQALRLDQLCEELLPPGREAVPWATMVAVQVLARLCEPSSDLDIAEDWYRGTALEDILGLPGVLRWKFQTGDGSDWVVAAPAVAADGTVYVGSDDGNVYAIGPPASGTAGELKWSFPTGNTVRCSPTIGRDGTLYVGADDYNLYALDPRPQGKTGQLKWSFATAGQVETAPAIGPDGTVYVGSFDGSLYAVTPPTSGTSGKRKWSFNTGEWIMSSPAVGADGMVYVGSDDYNVYAFNGTTGSIQWTYKTRSFVRSSPAIGADGTVYVGSYDGTLYAFTSHGSGTNGVLKWSYQLEGAVSAPAVAGDGTVYVSANLGLYAISPPKSGSTGVLKWSYQANGALSSPAIGNDATVYVNDEHHVNAVR